MNSNSIDSVLSFPTASLRGLLNLLCKTVKTLLVSLSRGTGSEKWHPLTRTQVDQGTVLMLVNVVETLQCRSLPAFIKFLR